MSRYIDADNLHNAKFQNTDGYGENVAYRVGWNEAIEAIEENEPTAIDIVRCKECRHWIGETEHYEDREYKACWQLCGQYMNSEFWCKYGEREGE